MIKWLANIWNNISYCKNKKSEYLSNHIKEHTVNKVVWLDDIKYQTSDNVRWAFDTGQKCIWYKYWWFGHKTQTCEIMEKTIASHNKYYTATYIIKYNNKCITVNESDLIIDNG